MTVFNDLQIFFFSSATLFSFGEAVQTRARSSECSLETIEPIFKAIAVSFTSLKRENNGQNHISRSRERYQRPRNSFAFSMVLCCVSPSFYVIYNSCEVFLRSASFLLPWMIKKGARRRRSSYGDFRGRWLQLEPLSRAV